VAQLERGTQLIGAEEALHAVIVGPSPLLWRSHSAAPEYRRIASAKRGSPILIPSRSRGHPDLFEGSPRAWSNEGETFTELMAT